MANDFGIFGFAFIKNKSTYIEELEDIIGIKIDSKQFNVDFYNILRRDELYFYDQHGNEVCEDKGYFSVYDTKLLNTGNEQIFGVFERTRLDKKWSGIEFMTKDNIDNKIIDNQKFRMGKVMFDLWQDGLDFLEELKESAIPENWTYKYHSSSIPHPILKSYIENLVEKITFSQPDKYLIMSDAKNFAIFNTGLLDKFFHDIYLICYVKQVKDMIKLMNPFIMKSLSDLNKIKFLYNGKILSNNSLPQKVKFFDTVNQVVFQSDIPIDRNYEKFTHIIEERRSRFPIEFRNKDITYLARVLDNSINYAVAIAERNYKLIVPQYRPQENKLQLLMPIYLNGTFTKIPDFALVLNLEENLYIPETILPLDAAYQNARLIAKPDDFWLNPDVI